MAVSRAEITVPVPRPLTSLIGREQELTLLYDLLRSNVRLVTLTGLGGIGKTRLALQAALELEPTFDAGVIFVPMAAITRVRSMPIAIARTAGLDESIETVAELAESLGPTAQLLVLDNLEQILDAAEVVLELMTQLPQLTVLTTSRIRLDIAGEHVLPLEPFPVQEQMSADHPAVQLFMERATASVPSMPTDAAAIAIISEICQQVDGIPLAIELAAARIAIFSLSDLRDQLHRQLPVLASSRADLPQRQRTMRNAISWTYDLLEPPEKRLFCWLAVYERDFSLDSVRHVAHQLELTEDPIDLVQFLVSRSLVRPSQSESSSPRYQMLQVLREFGHEQLLADSEDNLARRSHANDLVALCERAEPHLTTAEASTWMPRLLEDVANIHSGLEWAVANDHHDLAQRIFGSVWRFMEFYGLVRTFLKVMPNTEEGTAEPEVRARALVGIGYIHEAVRELEDAERYFQEAVSLAEGLVDQTTYVHALSGLATISVNYSDVPQARSLYTQAQELSERIGYDRGQVVALGMLASLDYYTGEYDQAISQNLHMLSLVEQGSDPGLLSMSYGNLAICYQAQSKWDQAETYLLKGLEVSTSVGDVYGMASAYANISGNLMGQRRNDEVKAAAEKGLEIARSAGLRQVEVTLLNNLVAVNHHEEDFGAVAQVLAQAIRIDKTEGGLKQQVEMASTFLDICITLKMLDNAAELLGAIRHFRETLEIGPTLARGNAETEALELIDPDNNHHHAELMRQGAGMDQAALVRRMGELAAEIVKVCPPRSAVPEREEKPEYQLTPRETEVLGMMVSGMSNAEISDAMFVSQRTVTTHVSNIFAKLNVNSRARAAALAMREGLV